MTAKSSDFRKIPKHAEEVAYQLMDIFLYSVPHSYCRATMVANLRKKNSTKLPDMWPGMKLVHGKPRLTQSEGSLSVTYTSQFTDSFVSCFGKDRTQNILKLHLCIT